VELATTFVNLFDLFLGAFKYREAKTSLTAVRVSARPSEYSPLPKKRLCLRQRYSPV